MHTDQAGSATRLITIPFSHYCEKARWALQHHDITFREEPHPPLLHWIANARVGAQRTVPVVLADTLLTDSTDILKWADASGSGAPLYPEAHRAEIEALEDRFDKKLGPAVRRIVYFHLRDARPLWRTITRTAAPGLEGALGGLLFPVIARMMIEGMNIKEEPTARSMKRLLAVLDDVDALLEDGRTFLVGDTFTAADLTFAALLAPLLYPAGHGYQMPPLQHYPAPLRALIDEVRARPAGAFGLRLYDTCRA